MSEAGDSSCPLNTVDLNDLDLATIAQYGASLCVDRRTRSCVMVPNTWAAIQPPTNANYGAATVPLWVSLQKYPQFGSGNYGDGNGVVVHGYPGGDSIYHSLQTKVQKRLTHHFTTLASFTWAKLITDDSQPPLSFVGSHAGAPQDWRRSAVRALGQPAGREVSVHRAGILRPAGWQGPAR